MKTLKIIQAGRRPAELPADGWFPPEGATGIAVRFEIRGEKYVSALWDDDPEGALRMCDLWGPGIRVTGEVWMESGRIFEKIEALVRQFGIDAASRGD